jgi:hypothetical protein
LSEKSSKLRITHSQLENCTLGCGVNGLHQMRTRYSECRCSEDTECPLSFKVNYCQKSTHSELFEEPDKNLDCISHQDNEEKVQKPTRGVANVVRDRIEMLCKEDADITPKRILTKLITERKATKSFHKNLIPTLSQVNQLVIFVVISHLYVVHNNCIN